MSGSRPGKECGSYVPEGCNASAIGHGLSNTFSLNILWTDADMIKVASETLLESRRHTNHGKTHILNKATTSSADTKLNISG